MAAYDVSIIGAGPGGYVAAIRAAQLGAKVCVIEKDNLGGVCLNKGCIPTKALLKSASVVSQIKEAADFGVDIDSYRINFPKILSRKKEIVERLNKGVELLLEMRAIELIKGKAKIINHHQIEITNSGPLTTNAKIESKNIIIATGSRPAELATLKFDHKNILSSDAILNISEIPQSLLIVGAGAIGCEFASLFNELGTQVTIVEMMEQILPDQDREIAKRLTGIFKKQGIKILTKTKVELAQEEGGKLSFKLSDAAPVSLERKADVSALQPETLGGIKVEKVLVCVGRLPNTENLRLEDIGVGTEKGYVIVDEYLKTNIPHIFAIGDCIGGHLLAHVASYEGKVAAANALGGRKKVDYLAVPNCIFTHPEVASVGLTADQAREKGLDVKVGKFPFTALGKAQVMGETEGLVKIVIDKVSDHILGAQLLGAGSTELIAELALAVKLKAKGRSLADTIHAHPTMAEAIMEAVESCYDEAIHLSR